MIKKWFIAARPKTLFVSLAPVIMASSLAYYNDTFKILPAVICAVFAMLAQITSNFINDYSDVVKGSDRADRMGPERAVATGLISAKSMLRATIVTISIALLLGLTLIYWGGFILLPVGLLVAVFAFAYSCGPYPLSYHGLGDIAVIVFFGIVPVVFTYYVQSMQFSSEVFFISLALGILASTLLIVHNYRVMETDKLSRKNTTVVLFGREKMRTVYLLNVIFACFIAFFYLATDNLFLLPLILPTLIIGLKIGRAHV